MDPMDQMDSMDPMAYPTGEVVVYDCVPHYAYVSMLVCYMLMWVTLLTLWVVDEVKRCRRKASVESVKPVEPTAPVKPVMAPKYVALV